MGGPWEDYQSSDGPWADYAPNKSAAKAKPKANVFADMAASAWKGLGEGVASLADTAQTAAVDPVLNMFSTAATAADAARGRFTNGATAPFSGATQAMAKANPYTPQTKAGDYARSVGSMVPNAIVSPGSVPARVAAVVIPGVTSQAAADAAQAAGAGPRGQAAARVAGGVVGGLAASVRVNPFKQPENPDEQVAGILAQRGKVDPEAMQARADEMQAAGVQPTLTDVAGDRGRRLIRAVGAKNEVAGETLADRAATTSASTKPEVMSRARDLGPFQGMTADELVGQLFKNRDQAANANYGGAYETQVPLDQNILAALSDAPGRAALQRARQAAVARMDNPRVAEIDSLLNASPPPETVSAGTLDRAQIAFRERAKTAAQRNANDMASGLNMRRGMINDALDQVPELTPARADYRAKSQAIGVLGNGRADVFSTDPADYGRWLEGLSPEARDANKVAIRQEILDTLGGQRASTFGTLDELATSQYAKANLRQALGSEADGFINYVTAKLKQTRNAGMVNPNAGSRTAPLGNDMAKLGGVASVVRSGFRGDLAGVAGKLAQMWVSRGLSDADAQALANAAVDPARLPGVVSYLNARFEPYTAQKFLQDMRNPALLGTAAGTIAARRNTPEDQQARSSRR